jgi:hypothetical protein
VPKPKKKDTRCVCLPCLFFAAFFARQFQIDSSLLQTKIQPRKRQQIASATEIGVGKLHQTWGAFFSFNLPELCRHIKRVERVAHYRPH